MRVLLYGGLLTAALVTAAPVRADDLIWAPYRWKTLNPCEAKQAGIGLCDLVQLRMPDVQDDEQLVTRVINPALAKLKWGYIGTISYMPVALDGLIDQTETKALLHGATRADGWIRVRVTPADKAQRRQVYVTLFLARDREVLGTEVDSNPQFAGPGAARAMLQPWGTSRAYQADP